MRRDMSRKIICSLVLGWFLLPAGAMAQYGGYGDYFYYQQQQAQQQAKAKRKEELRNRRQSAENQTDNLSSLAKMLRDKAANKGTTQNTQQQADGYPAVPGAAGSYPMVDPSIFAGTMLTEKQKQELMEQQQRMAEEEAARKRKEEEERFHPSGLERVKAERVYKKMKEDAFRPRWGLREEPVNEMSARSTLMDYDIQQENSITLKPKRLNRMAGAGLE